LEKIMKKNIAIDIAVLVIVPMLNASPAQGTANPFVQGTVIEVQKQKVYFPDYAIGGSNPSDAPLTSRYYAYRVSVRVDCKTYVGWYETVLNYLPSEFTPNEPIQVRLTRHVMYFDLPYDPDLKMGIVRRERVCRANR
ncbi:MAG: hypothetical protein WA847_19705, partial [Terriglobales bacterium]